MSFEENPEDPSPLESPTQGEDSGPRRGKRGSRRSLAKQAIRRERRARRAELLETTALRAASIIVVILSPALLLLRADPSAVRAILGAQLRSEFRRQRGVTERNTFIMKLAGGLFLGALAAALLFVIPIPSVWMTLAQGALLIFTVFGTLEAVPHLLIDRRDLAVICSAPVRDLTFFVARVIEIIVVVGLVIGSQALPMFIAGLIKWPTLPFALVFSIATLLSGLLAVFATLILYLGVLRIFPPQRARDVILFAQVGLTVLLFGSIQLGPRLAGKQDIRALVESATAARDWIPPYYAGEWFRVALGGEMADTRLLALAFLVPLLAGLGALAIASSGLLSRLGAAEGGGASDTEVAPGNRQRRGAFLDPLVRRIIRDPVERAGYDQFRLLSRRERGFRLRTYPTLALSVIFGVGYLFNFVEDGPPVFNGSLLAIPVYFAYLYAPIFVLQARYSDDGDARWMFDVAPISEPGRLVAGMGVGLALCFLVPVSLVIAIGVVAVGGVEVIPHVLVGVAFIAFATLFTVEKVGPGLPFSEPFRPQVGMTNFGLLMLTGVVQGTAIGVHLVVAMVPGAVWGLLVLYGVLARLMLFRLRNMRPREVDVRWFPTGKNSAAMIAAIATARPGQVSSVDEALLDDPEEP